MLPTTLSTVANYDGRISSFSDWAFGTASVEASRIRQIFIDNLSKISTDGIILDVGSGPGRDMEAFLDSGYKVIGIEPSQPFCRATHQLLSSKYSSDLFSIVQGDICDMSVLKSDSFQTQQIVGAFCLASLFHIPYSQLHGALSNIKSVLTTGGLILSSFPIKSSCGDRMEGIEMPDGRWCTALSAQQHTKLLKDNNFTVVQSFVCNIYNGNWSCIVASKD